MNNLVLFASLSVCLILSIEVQGDTDSEFAEFIRAALDAKPDRVEELFENGANINAKGEDGQTSLMNAANNELYDVPVGIIILLSLFYGTISLLTVLGNSLVIWIIATTKSMQTATNSFISNLALADVVIGVFCIPFQFQAALLQRWNLPEFMCPFCPFIQTLCVNVSIFTLIAIAIDRHRAIIHPLRAKPSKYVSKLMISGIWIVSLILSIPTTIALRVVPIIEHRTYEYGKIILSEKLFCDNTGFSESLMREYRYCLALFQYMIPLCVITFMYVQVAITLWGSKTPGNAQNSRDVSLMKNKKKVIKMLIVVVLLFGICWCPLQVYNILEVTWDCVNEYKYINIVWFCSHWLAMSNSCHNPFIYGFYNDKFRREFQRRFPIFRLKDNTSDVD